MIDYPKTLLEFLQNIKTLTESDLLDHGDTYTDENLLRLFGTQGVWWQFNDAARKQGELVGYDQFIGKSELPNGNIFPGMSLSFLYHKSNESSHVRISINFRVDSNISFSQIEDLFGSNWALDEEAFSNRVIQTGRKFKQSTHEMGNKPIIFRLSPKPNEKTIAIELAANGNLSSLCFLAKGSTK